MAGEPEEIGKMTVGTYMLCSVQYAEWPVLGFGAGLVPADEGKNASVHPKVGEAGGRRWRRRPWGTARRI